ncbi:hypothetical protein [Streptomyces sp. NPDC019224]|uniref:SCO6745 family protein n=1 Tax=Streptomyces sp. NPDC019224 TaxID=3154484 RepID=UPI0033D94507
MPTQLPVRQCQSVLNTIHSTVYFSPDHDGEMAAFGVTDPMACYLAGRAAALGPVGPGVVTAAFYSFRHDMIGGHLPALWQRITPEEATAARTRAADLTLRRVLGPEAIGSSAMRRAALLALRATEGGTRHGRTLYAALADQPVPEEPHLALWHAATLLREHRGDSHIGALTAADLDGIEALVSHSASDTGMPRDVVMTKRGWTEGDWTAAERRLNERGLLDADGRLTGQGRTLREDLEHDTDRRDRAPYEHLGADGAAELTRLAGEFVAAAAAGGAFPPFLVDLFAPARRG